MKIAVFVGSFDPVHLGHERAIHYLLDEKICDKVLVIATMAYWHKTRLTDLNERIAMLKLISSENIIIDDRHNETAYTYEILEDLKKDGQDYYLVIGEDNAQSLHLWKRYDIIKKYPLIISGRKGYELKIDHPNYHFIDHSFGKIASSQIREDVDRYKDMLNDKVYRYIKEKKLYQ